MFTALRRATPSLAAFAAIAARVLADFFAPFEHLLMDSRFKAQSRDATGKLIIVEIDAKSLNALSTWPWPRERHAELIGILTAAGAERIAFDVDFSSSSNAASDAALAGAIERANGRVILPAFGQRETTSHENTRTIASEPLPAFRDFALIGHVNIWPIGSLARTVRAGVFFGDVYRPAMAALVSEQTVQTLEERYIDFSIDPFTIPRLSYSDIIQGRFDAGSVKGRTLIVGGTAIELGDRLPVPVHGVLPGVTVQALAAESMSLGRSIVRTGPIVSLSMALAVLLLFRAPVFAGWARAAAAAAILTGAFLFGAVHVQEAAAISTDLGAPLAMLGFCVVWAAAWDLADRQRKLRAERARSAARQSLIRRIVEDSSDGIAAIDLSGRIVICNSQAATLFSTSIDAMQGQQIEAFLPVSAEPLVHSADRDKGFPFAFEHQVEFTGGTPRVVEAVVNRSALGETVSEPVLVVTLRDVTLRKQMEEAQRRAAEEKLIAERAKSLFIANMSHELRTPLNAIIGFSEIIESESFGKLGNAKYKEYATIVLKSGQHLLDMVNNVLEISRLESGGIRAEMRMSEMEPLIESSFAFIRNSRDFDGQTLRFVEPDGPLIAFTDVRLLRQILVNLLSNAIKFASPDKKNTAVVSVSRQENRTLRIEVKDDGAGMSEQTLAQVTSMFFQGDGTFTRKHEGRGLGLYLVKKHVEILGGHLSFVSVPGEGTTVTIDLPNGVAERDSRAA
jgi:PAS domain S-box-containing protein